MNKIILIGRLTRDVEMRYGTNNNNTAIARYTLAVNRPYKQNGSYTNRDGQKVYTTDVVVERQEFLEKMADNSQPDSGTAESYDDRYMDTPDGIDEDLPFN